MRQLLSFGCRRWSNFNDKNLNIDWKLGEDEKQLSQKDKELMSFKEFNKDVLIKKNNEQKKNTH
jgi:hypothetical protein